MDRGRPSDNPQPQHQAFSPESALLVPYQSDQLVASGLAGIWKAHTSRYLEETVLPAGAIFNVMDINARKYLSLEKTMRSNRQPKKQGP